MSPFAYKEPTLEELHRRLQTGDAFVQSTMGPGGAYEEYYQAPTQVPSQVITGRPPDEVTGGGLEGAFLGEGAGFAADSQGRSLEQRNMRLMELEIGGVPVSAIVPAAVMVSGLPAAAGGLQNLGSSLLQKLPAVPGVIKAFESGGFVPGLAALAGLFGLGGAAAGILGLMGGDGGGGGGKLNGGSNMTTGTIVTGATQVNGVPFGGPGVPEPPAGMVSKAWKTKSFSNRVGEYWVYHWLLLDGRRLTWNAAKRQAKVWRPQHNITLGPKPRVKDLIRINKKVNMLNKGLKKQLKRAGVEL